MKRISLLRMVALTAVLLSLAPRPTLADDYDKKTIVTFNQPTEVPGIVLEPGTYVIRLVNSQSNRHIAEIMNEKMDHLYSLSFTAAAERVQRTGEPVLTFYEGAKGQPQAIRRWFWPGEVTGIEFLYPKSQAAKIAYATNQRVAEGGLPTVAESGQSLTPDSAQTLVAQGPTEIKTEVKEQESQPAPAPVVAAVAEPAVVPAPEPAPAPIVIAQNTPPPARVDDVVPTPAVSSDTRTLPQTASNLPLIGAIGFISLGLAIVVASARRYRLL